MFVTYNDILDIHYIEYINSALGVQLVPTVSSRSSVKNYKAHDEQKNKQVVLPRFDLRFRTMPKNMQKDLEN